MPLTQSHDLPFQEPEAVRFSLGSHTVACRERECCSICVFGLFDKVGVTALTSLVLVLVHLTTLLQ